LHGVSTEINNITNSSPVQTLTTIHQTLTGIKAVNTVKDRAKQTMETPAQIIQTVSINSSHETHQYLPSRDALCQSINRIRNSDLPTEPESLDDLIIPEDLKKNSRWI